MQIIESDKGWKQSYTLYLAAGFSFLSSLLWLLTAFAAGANRVMWLSLFALFLVQGCWWLSAGNRARRREK